jgi:hypothetical protein
MTAPPIPLRLAGRPTMGGLVVPWISVQHRDGRAILGAIHGSRTDTCIRQRRCQTCGDPLGERIVLFARPRDIARGYIAEPALHPDCAAYSAKACPMINGSMTKYRTSPHKVDGKPCGEPGCDCAGWISADDQKARSDQPAEPWFALWITPGDYRTAVNEHGKLVGIVVKDLTPLKIRSLNDLANEHLPAVEAIYAMRTLWKMG